MTKLWNGSLSVKGGGGGGRGRLLEHISFCRISINVLSSRLEVQMFDSQHFREFSKRFLQER